MSVHDRKKLAAEIGKARKKRRVYGLGRSSAIDRARKLDQQISPGARGGGNRFRRMVEKSKTPGATITQIEKTLKKFGRDI